MRAISASLMRSCCLLGGRFVLLYWLRDDGDRLGVGCTAPALESVGLSGHVRQGGAQYGGLRDLRWTCALAGLGRCQTIQSAKGRCHRRCLVHHGLDLCCANL
eukprot:1192852-Prorocentrum_minimum.AAC.3